MPLQAGQMLNNRYRIVRLLGQGGFGAVYRAWDTNLNKPCAVKENLDTSPEAQRQFTREATVLANLSHENLPRVTDHYILPDQGQYLVMDFVEGEDLASMVQRQGPVPLDQALLWVSQVADALSYLHTRQPVVVHRDVKPANIRITPEGKAMLVDFGLVKIYDPHMRTTLGARAVTPGYAPPEQYGQGNTDARTDLYALGATLYNLLTGRPPMESVQRMSGRQMPAAHQVNTQVPAHIGLAIERSMRLEPDQRYQTVAEFKAALASPPQPALVRPAPEAQLRPAVAPGSAASAYPEAQPQAQRPRPARPPVSMPISKPRPQPQKSRRLGFGVGALAISLLCLLGVLVFGAWVFGNDDEITRQTEDARFQATLEERVRLTSTAQAAPTLTARARSADQSSVQATSQAVEARLSGQKAARVLEFGPKAGELPHDPGNGLIESLEAGVDLKNLFLQARFTNPHAASKSPWDYGFIFRHEGKNQHYRFLIHSDRSCTTPPSGPKAIERASP